MKLLEKKNKNMAYRKLFLCSEVIERRSQQDNDQIDILEMLPGVRVIEQFAFHRCINLGTVNFSDTLEVIEAFAFRQCKNLRYVHLPDNLTTVEAFAFTQTGISNDHGIITIKSGSPLALLVEIGSESVEGLLQLKDRICYV